MDKRRIAEVLFEVGEPGQSLWQARSYALDDGKDLGGLKGADVVLVGPSGTGKTWICATLALWDVVAANVPLLFKKETVDVGNAPLRRYAKNNAPLVIGLVCHPEQMGVQRGCARKDVAGTCCPARVAKETKLTRLYFEEIGCAIVDCFKRGVAPGEVVQRSICEIAAEIHKRISDRKNASRFKRGCFL